MKFDSMNISCNDYRLIEWLYKVKYWLSGLSVLPTSKGHASQILEVFLIKKQIFWFLT